MSILLGRGDGSFVSPVNYGVGKTPKSVAAADLNGDGRIDLVTANQDGASVSVLLNLGNGTFAPAVNYTATASGNSGITRNEGNG